ncbi:MAG: hypothetical protein ACOCW3_02350 [Spirochaetota bacterium]
MEVEVDVSLYALGPSSVAHPVDDLVGVFGEHGCEVTTTSTSLIVTGKSEDIFTSLRIGYERAADKGACVLVVKACNACQL